MSSASSSISRSRREQADEQGRWYFQNGPQRVYVSLAYTPLVLHYEGVALFDHCGRPFAATSGALQDEEGSVLFAGAGTVALLDDRDLARIAGAEAEGPEAEAGDEREEDGRAGELPQPVGDQPVGAAGRDRRVVVIAIEIAHGVIACVDTLYPVGAAAPTPKCLNGCVPRTSPSGASPRIAGLPAITTGTRSAHLVHRRHPEDPEPRLDHHLRRPHQRQPRAAQVRGVLADEAQGRLELALMLQCMKFRRQLIEIEGDPVRLVRARGVTVQAVAGGLAIYLLIGLVFAFAVAVFAKYGDGAYFTNGKDGTLGQQAYFSFTVMTTTGLGDFAPATQGGRAFATLEMLFGQVYLVTVVALLVSNLRRNPPTTR